MEVRVLSSALFFIFIYFFPTYVLSAPLDRGDKKLIQIYWKIFYEIKSGKVKGDFANFALIPLYSRSWNFRIKPLQSRFFNEQNFTKILKLRLKDVRYCINKRVEIFYKKFSSLLRQTKHPIFAHLKGVPLYKLKYVFRKNSKVIKKLSTKLSLKIFLVINKYGRNIEYHFRGQKNIPIISECLEWYLGGRKYFPPEKVDKALFSAQIYLVE